MRQWRPARTQGYVYLRSEYPRARDVLTRALVAARPRRRARPRRMRYRTRVRHRVAHGCRRVRLRRRDVDAREHRRKRGAGSVQTAGARSPWTVRQTHADTQRADACAGTTVSAAAVPLTPSSVGDGRAARCRFSSVATSRTAASSSCHSAFRCAACCRNSAAAAAPESRCVPCRSADRSGAYLPPSLWDTHSTTKRSRAQSAMLGHGGIVAFDDTVDSASRRSSRCNSALTNRAANARRAGSARCAASK